METAVSFLDKAKKSVEVCHPADKRLERLNLRKRQLVETKTDLAQLLPVEGSTGREMIGRRIELLEHTISDPTFEERYACLSMEVLGWRDKQGFPKLAPFSLTDPAFSILGDARYKSVDHSLRWTQTFGVSPELPLPMTEMYTDIFESFRAELEKDKQAVARAESWSKSITARFSGIIPQHVREIIKSAAADFTVSIERVETEKIGWLRRKRQVAKTDVVINIFLVAEVDEWEVNKVVVQHPDPLIVGYKGGCLWLIGSFDETPLEEYVRREFRV